MTASSAIRPFWTTKEIARLGMMLALASALHLFEAQLPTLPIPGAKIGLANVVSMFLLYTWGFREALLLTIMRQIIASFLTGTLFAPTFFFGLAGGVVSITTMVLLKTMSRRLFGPVSVSLVGAATHNVGQLLVAWALLGHVQIFYYLPYLLWFAIPSGLLVGMAVQHVLPLAPIVGNTTSTSQQQYTIGGDSENNRSSFVAYRRSAWFVGGTIGILGIVIATNAFHRTPVVLADAAAYISVGNEIVAVLPLKDDHTEQITTSGGRLTVETKDGRVRIARSDCFNQVCVRTGWIQYAHESIVCLPFQVMVTIHGSTEGPDDFDAIIF